LFLPRDTKAAALPPHSKSGGARREMRFSFGLR
jgi:hypothetical protein